MQTAVRAQLTVASAQQAKPQNKVLAAVPRVAKALGAGVATLALTLSANAVTVKMGADNGALVFDPSSVTVGKGEAVTFVNNAGFPHNVAFDEDAVPGGVNADAISHEDYFTAPGESYTV
ncbi:plastocyanin/azurin family copper-binding protein, partial [Klebsiella pneumoniae]|uniref:plastocyanin/azurin family copper-binding protein n=1 Tax=Klebsiella pneumoniae TaxID=573 RepID=UPI0025A2876B